MKSARINPYCRLFFVTNATLLNDEIFDTLRQKESVSYLFLLMQQMKKHILFSVKGGTG